MRYCVSAVRANDATVRRAAALKRRGRSPRRRSSRMRSCADRATRREPRPRGDHGGAGIGRRGVRRPARRRSAASDADGRSTAAAKMRACRGVMHVAGCATCRRRVAASASDGEARHGAAGRCEIRSGIPLTSERRPSVRPNGTLPAAVPRVRAVLDGPAESEVRRTARVRMSIGCRASGNGRGLDRAEDGDDRMRERRRRSAGARAAVRPPTARRASRRRPRTGTRQRPG